MSHPVLDSLLNHRSIRKFKPDPIPEGTIETILRAGTRAATAGNLQPYAFVVIDDPEKLQQISSLRGPLAIAALVDQYRLKRYFELNGAPFYNDRPINVFISYWDATIALQNVVIAAESLDLGTVYIGMILSMDLREVLGVPEYVVPAGLVVMGYPDEGPELRPRLPLEAIVHRNTYHVPSDEAIRDWYRAADEAWKDWFEHEASEEQRAKFKERGITNRAQNITIGHYTEKFIEQETRGLLENLRRAGFRWNEGE